MSDPGERLDIDRLNHAADLVLAAVTAQDPSYVVTVESHVRMVELLEAVVRLLLSGRPQ